LAAIQAPIEHAIRAISGIPERSATRALKWAVEARVLVNQGGTYVPGPVWVGSGARRAEAIASERIGG
jgi:hypothetical protein